MAAEGDGGPQLSELESLQLKANQVTDESLESTRRMIQLCEEVGHCLFSKFKDNQSKISKSNVDR